MQISRLDLSLLGLSLVFITLIGYQLMSSHTIKDDLSSIELSATIKSERRGSVGAGSYQFVTQDLARLSEDRDQIYQSNLERRKDDEAHFWELSPQPLPETISTSHFGWTGKNLKDSASLELVANNSNMKERLKEENTWTTKRELVYVKEPFFDDAYQVISGQNDTLEVPGLDGEVYKIIISEDQLYFDNPSEMMGAFTGHLEGDSDVAVNVGMCGKTWSVEILLDGDHMIDITGRPDMGGEWVITEVDRRKLQATEGPSKCIENRDPDQLSRQHSTDTQPAEVGDVRPE